jgi:hypothetical protein
VGAVDLVAAISALDGREAAELQRIAGSAPRSAASRGLAAEPGEEPHRPLRAAAHLGRRAGRDLTAEAGDLDRRGGLDHLATGDGERPGLVCARDAPRALGRVEAGGLGGAERLITERGVAVGFLSFMALLLSPTEGAAP